MKLDDSSGETGGRIVNHCANHHCTLLPQTYSNIGE